jgi:tRNA (cytidine56-2'-O)-methyltransferase
VQEEIYILRIGHRIERDKRITTHVGLVARAFGAKGIFLVNTERKIKEKLNKITGLWGGPFVVDEIENDWRKFVFDWKDNDGVVVHLTMYGLPVEEKIDEIREKRGKKLVVVGAEKVPRDLYSISDYNISITDQPHSEVAALAVFLDRFYRGKELSLRFSNARLNIIPSERGKRIVES